jgi:A/G-specific adenine glycosylase
MKPPKPSEIDSFREDLLSWSESNLREYPWRKSDDSYRVLVAEILLQKTFADKVEPIYDEFVDRYPRLDALTEAKVEAVTSLLKPLGLQNVRAKALIDIANEYADGGIPDDKEALLELPYVGPYAANATLCFAFDERRPIVDANVVRVFNRAFGLDLTPQDEKAWEIADRVLPDQDYQRFNLALVDFGAKICTADSPRCLDCFYNDLCTYYATTKEE